MCQGYEIVLEFLPSSGQKTINAVLKLFFLQNIWWPKSFPLIVLLLACKPGYMNLLRQFSDNKYINMFLY